MSHQIIRTREELAALDPDTVLITGGYADLWTAEEVSATSDPAWFLPVVVLATGDETRAAQQTLESADAVD
jgi:hypothetical protein